MANGNGSNGPFWKFLDLLVKGALPVTVGIFACKQTKGSIKVAEAQYQTALARMAWDALTSRDEQLKKVGFRILTQLDSGFAARVAFAFSQDSTQSVELRVGASQYVAAVRGRSWERYKIDIYYVEGAARAKSIAERMDSAITALSPQTHVVIAPRPIAFFATTGMPRGNEVRYEPSREDGPAQALVALFNSIDPTLNVRLRPVLNRTPGTLSIYVWTAKG